MYYNFNQRMNKQYLIISTTVTFFLVRFWETVMVLFFEKSFLWQSIKNDNLDHYQLGFLLLLVCGLFWKKLNGKLKMIICGIGAGLIIDDIYQILSILLGFPYTFNSFFEWTSALVFYFAFLSFLTIKSRKVYYALGIIGVTVFIIRVITAVAIYFIGTTSLWNSIYTDNWNHYQLGIVLLLISVFLKKKLGNYLVPLFAIGTALILDEVTDVLKVFSFQFPPNFRDGPFDLLLILLSFLLFVCVVKLIEIIYVRIVDYKNKKWAEGAISQKAVSQFNEWAPNYDSGVSHYFFDLCNREVIKILKLRNDTKLLDVGCGTGSLLLEILKRQKGLQLHGVDSSPEMTRLANAKLRGFGHIFLKIGSGNSLPYEQNYFDHVVCAHSLHHHPNPGKSFSEMTRVLKPGGQLIVVDGFTDNILRKIMFLAVQLIQREGPVQRFTKQEMSTFFKKFGFKNIIQKEFQYFNLITFGVKIK